MTPSNGNISALLALCGGNSPVTSEFPTQRPVTRSFDVYFDLRLNKRLSEQSRGWWFETPSRSLWRHCNVDRFKSQQSGNHAPFRPHFTKMDKSLRPKQNLGWNHLSIPKLQRCLRTDKEFHSNLYWACDYLFILGVKLIHAGKRGPCSPTRKSPMNDIDNRNVCKIR